MLDFEKELERFKPSLEVEDAEDAIGQNDLTDVTDIVKELLEEIKNR